MDEDDLTVDDRFSSRDIGKGSGDIISAIRDIIDADKALLETDPEAVLVSERAEARLRAALERLTGGSDTPPTVLEASNTVGGVSEPPVRRSSAARNRASARSETKTASGSVSSNALSASIMSRIADMISPDPLPMSRLLNLSSTVKSSSSIN